MKKYVILIATISIILFSTANNACASWYFELDNTNNDNVFDIWFRADETITLDSYTLIFGYDTGEMAWSPSGVGVLGTDYTHVPPSPLFEGFGSPYETPNAGSGYITNFSAMTFVGNAELTGDYKLGTLIYTILPSAVQDDADDLWWELSDPNFYFLVNGVEYFPGVDGYGDHLNAGEGLDTVPIPGAIWLFGSGMLGLIGIRRRTKSEMII